MAATEPKWRRLGGLLGAGVGALAGTTARAETTLDFRYLFYGESDNRTQVLNPEMALQQDWGEKGRLGLLLSYDSISGASPTGEAPVADAVATASSAGGTFPMVEYKDTRRAGSVSYGLRMGSHLPSVGLSYSRESDYLSRGVSLVDSWDLFGKRSTLHLGYGGTEDEVFPAKTDFRFPKSSRSYSLGWTQVMGPRDLLDLSYGLMKLDGYLTDPYKKVTVGTTVVPEVRPDTRSRNTAMVKYGHYYLARSALKLSYRYYWDDWSVAAHTAELQWDKRAGSKLIVSPRLRYYTQNSASFFAYEFATPQTYMSSDYRLSAFWSWLVGLGFTIEASRTVSFNLEATYQDQTGIDRVAAPPPAVIIPLRAGRLAAVPEEDDGGGEGGPSTLSAADMKVVTATFGFTFRF